MENNGRVLFLLGAGASVDSGLKTYRGEGDTYYANASMNDLIYAQLITPEGREIIWRNMDEIARDAQKCNAPGRTYERIREICKNSSEAVVLTQNVDGLAKRFLSEVALVHELHGSLEQIECCGCALKFPYKVIGNHLCPRCERDDMVRPDVILMGETCDPLPLQINVFRPDVIYIVGTSMRFPYLRKLVDKFKQKGAKRVIHVNPDPNYEEHKMRDKRRNRYDGTFDMVRVRRKKEEELRSEL